MSERTKILSEAGDLINGDRQDAYGDALECHKRIAAGWEQILGVKIKPHQVALCMAWVKTARAVTSPKRRDNYVDNAAYSALAGELVESQDNPPKSISDYVSERVFDGTRPLSKKYLDTLESIPRNGV